MKYSTIENGLHIIDATDPYRISLISKVSFQGWVEGVHIADDFAYVANCGTLRKDKKKYFCGEFHDD